MSLLLRNWWLWGINAMDKTPKSLRLQIGIVGRTNVGKSSFLNMIAGQDVAITSAHAGTTTDVVEKTMELLPLGPVVLLDTAGLDDSSVLGEKRVERTMRAIDRSDIVLLVVVSNVWGQAEEQCIELIKKQKKSLVIVINKIDEIPPSDEFLLSIRKIATEVISVSSIDLALRDTQVNALKQVLIRICPEQFLNAPTLLGDLLPAGGMVVMVVPIDLQAPKGRLILPQVQAIRDALDNDATAVVVKEREYAALLKRLNKAPDLVVCDSQVVMKVMADTPVDVKCTTFSILMARFKGDLIELVRGAAHIDNLKSNDRILISESCSHHAAEDDIGRVKIPRWLRQYIGGDLQIDHFSGRDYPKDLQQYKLIVHCGACMLTRGEMLLRIHRAQECAVPVTNYGVAISLVQGVLKRALSPFPAALDAFEKDRSILCK